MKTPECCRALPWRPPCQFSCPIVLLTCVMMSHGDGMLWHHTTPYGVVTSHGVVTSRRDITWRCDITLWRHMALWLHSMRSDYVICDDRVNAHKSTHLTITIFKQATLPLTFELIRDIIEVNLRTNFQICMSNGSAGRALTDRRTHRRVRFYTLDR